MNDGSRPTLARAFRRAALPLCSYYAVTLALPMANGAAQFGAAFVGHAVVVLVLPPLLIALAQAVHVLGQICYFRVRISSTKRSRPWTSWCRCARSRKG